MERHARMLCKSCITVSPPESIARTGGDEVTPNESSVWRVHPILRQTPVLQVHPDPGGPSWAEPHTYFG